MKTIKCAEKYTRRIFLSFFKQLNRQVRFPAFALLKTEAPKSSRQQRTLKQLHEELRELGFAGSYDRVAAFARVWRVDQAGMVRSASKRTIMRKI